MSRLPRSRERGRDRWRRKSRSDKGKPRKRYAGKPTKKKRTLRGKKVSYPPKSRRKTTIKLYIWGLSPTSPEGFRRIPRPLRKTARRIVYGKGKARIRIDASVFDINTPEKIERFCENNLWEGQWLILTFSHKKNKFHVSPIGTFDVIVRETPRGLRARMIRNRSGFRRWWWKG